MSVTVRFPVMQKGGPGRLVAEAELVFDGPEFGPLAGMKLAGFSLWRRGQGEEGNGEVYVTFPARTSGVAGERRYFDYLQPTEPTFARHGRAAPFSRVATFILAAWREHGGGR